MLCDAGWYPNTLLTGKAVLQYNLAVAYAIRGELDKSGETLKQVIEDLKIILQLGDKFLSLLFYYDYYFL